MGAQIAMVKSPFRHLNKSGPVFKSAEHLQLSLERGAGTSYANQNIPEFLSDQNLAAMAHLYCVLHKSQNGIKIAAGR